MKEKIKRFVRLLLVITLTNNLLHAQIWQPLSKGIESTPTAVTSAGNLLAVAYTLGLKKEQRIHEVAIWNGVYWFKLPTIYTDSTSRINALLFKDSSLYIAGQFKSVNDISGSHNIVRWVNKKYEGLSNLTGSSGSNSDEILHLNVLGDFLVVGGRFNNEVISDGSNLAFYRNDKWVTSNFALDGSINGAVTSSLVIGGRLFIGGKFDKIGSVETNYLAGFSATQVFKKEKNEFVPIKMVAYNKYGVFWGEHATNKGVSPNFFAFDSDTLFELNEGIEKVNDVYDIISDGGMIYAIGDFKLSGSNDKHNIIVFKKEKWEPLVGGVFQGALFASLLRDNLIVSGSFKAYRNIYVQNIAQYHANVGAVKGMIFFDKDANCKFNDNDEFLNNRTIRIDPGEQYIRPDENGNYLTFLKEGKYTLTLLPHKYWSASSCDALSKTVTIENGLITDNVDFALVQDTSIRDLSVRLNAQSGGIATRKNVQLYYINYQNLGSNEVNNGSVTLHFDQKLEDLSADPKPDFVAGDSAVWNINMLPGVAKTIKCKFKITGTATNQLNLQASIKQNSKTRDDDQNNNQSALIQTIQEEDIEINKQVFPGKVSGDTAFIEKDVTSVDYQISFSNYSDDTVNTVHVIDTITINHSMEEIRETGASHPYTYQIIPGMPGENVAIIIWTFKNINLAPNPTKNGEIVNDDGFIGFRIGLKSNLESGVMLQNKAQVAFDYSDKKGTNSVFAVVVEPSGIEKTIPTTHVKIYPNPTDNLLYINGEQTAKKIDYTIHSINGSVNISGSISPQDGIQVNSLPAGLYIIQGMVNGKMFTSKFVRL